MEQLNEAIIELLNNEHKMRSIGEKAHKSIAVNFTWESSAKKMIEVFEEVISQP